MPRFKGSPVEGTFTLIEGKQGWRGFIDFKGKSRRAVRDIEWRTPEQVTFRIDTWMGDTRPVFTLQQDQLSGYTLVGNVRYPTSGSKLTTIPAGVMPVVPDEQHQANILGAKPPSGRKTSAHRCSISSCGQEPLPWRNVCGRPRM